MKSDCTKLKNKNFHDRKENMAALTENRNVSNKCICKHEREQEEDGINFDEDKKKACIISKSDNLKTLKSEILSLDNIQIKENQTLLSEGRNSNEIVFIAYLACTQHIIESGCEKYLCEVENICVSFNEAKRKNEIIATKRGTLFAPLEIELSN
ncbi:hypothetical protein JTB14_001002 [Gonioctena quinquepunctata]|nr:hypothetical protein JTB14_001002 [Gonioctena quinquepunctata]